MPYPDQETADAIAELEAYGQDLDADTTTLLRALLTPEPGQRVDRC